MKQFTFSILMAILSTSGAMAEHYDLRTPTTMESHQLRKHEFKNEKHTQKAEPRLAAAVTEQQEYTSFAMNFFKDGAFFYEGGSFSRYKTKITWYDNGNVCIDNLFNLRAHGDNDEDYLLWGTYDASRNVISIPTSYYEGEMTEVAAIYGELNGYLLAGETSEQLDFFPEEALELQLNDARNEIVTLQTALILEEYSGQLSTHTAVKYVKMFLPHSGPKMEVFADDEITYKSPLFPGESEEKSIYIANIGDATMEYVVDLESEAADSTFILTSASSGNLRSMLMRELKFTYKPTTPGSNDQATISISTDGGEWQAVIMGSCEDFPDYSALVDEGDIRFRTGSQFPFGLGKNLNGYYGYSTADYTGKGDSWLEAEVVVPAGQIGTLKWKGSCYIDYNWGAKVTIVNDNGTLLFESYMGNEVVDGHCMFSEGTHSVRFNFNATRPDFMVEEDKLLLSHFAFTTEPVVSDRVYLPSGSYLNFGNFVEHQEEPANTLRAHLLNMGTNKLKCTGATDSEHFHVVINDESASLLDTLLVSVIFNLPAAGTYQEDVVLNTTAGDVSLHCKALVREIPDYSVIVSADTDPSIPIIWDYSTTYPFVIDPETLEAVNSNARELDSIANASWMMATFTIPDGKVGVVKWDATLDIEGPSDDNSFYDYAMVFISHPGHQFGIIDMGQGDMSADACYTKWQEGETASGYYTAGENSVQWILSHYGNSYYEGQDEFRVKNFKITLEDFPDYYCRLSEEEIDFGELLLGRTNTYSLQLTNLGGKEIMIDSIVCDAPVSALSIPNYSIPLKESFNLSFSFEGTEAGEQEGAITIYTTGGEEIVLFRATVIDPTGYLMYEDFEDEMKWYRTDADGDGKGWNSLWNIYSTMSQGHCHSGDDGLGSSGYYYYMGEIDPDDWCYSPMVHIPATGNYELSWWMGVDDTDTDNYAHHYSVYVGEEMNRSTLTEMYTEQIESTGWKHHTLSLNDWKGKTVCVSFRHFNSKGLGIMKLDDVYIRPVADNSIQTVKSNRSEEVIYNLQGMRQQHSGKGLYIVRKNDKTQKIYK